MRTGACGQRGACLNSVSEVEQLRMSTGAELGELRWISRNHEARRSVKLPWKVARTEMLGRLWARVSNQSVSEGCSPGGWQRHRLAWEGDRAPAGGTGVRVRA